MKKMQTWLVGACLALGSMGLAHAAKISFIPAGAALDADAILDIVVAPNDIIKFDVYIDTVGLAGPLVNFKYTAKWDAFELQRLGLNMDPDGVFPVDQPPGAFLPTGATVSHLGANIPAGQNQFLIDTWSFKVLQPVNDGLKDFEVIVLNAESQAGGNIINQNGQYDDIFGGQRTPGSQAVEVQTQLIAPPPVPEPETYLLFGAGLAGVGLARRYRARNKQ